MPAVRHAQRSAPLRPVKPLSILVVATILAVGVARAQTPQALLEQYKCYLCHADKEAKAGPAYVDVASKYKGNPQAVAIVAATVRKGVRGAGPWHMPPHPEVSDSDATKMARYILSLKR
jgi:cytochrome c